MHLAWFAGGQSGLAWRPLSSPATKAPHASSSQWKRLRMASSRGRLKLSKSRRITNCPSPASPSWTPELGNRDLRIGGVKFEVPVIEPVRWPSQLLHTDGHGLGPAASPCLCPEGLRAPPELELEQGPEWSPRESWAMGHICPSSEASSVKRVGGRERQGRGHPADRDMGKTEGQRRTQVTRGTKD